MHAHAIALVIATAIVIAAPLHCYMILPSMPCPWQEHGNNMTRSWRKHSMARAWQSHATILPCNLHDLAMWLPW
jgi:hypothetical protein